jgi:hypothetical protein
MRDFRIANPFEDDKHASRVQSSPAHAVRLTSDRALELIPRLMNPGYGKWTGGGPYLEPVKPEDARKNFRSLRFFVT